MAFNSINGKLEMMKRHLKKGILDTKDLNWLIGKYRESRKDINQLIATSKKQAKRIKQLEEQLYFKEEEMSVDVDLELMTANLIGNGMMGSYAGVTTGRMSVSKPNMSMPPQHKDQADALRYAPLQNCKRLFMQPSFSEVNQMNLPENRLRDVYNTVDAMSKLGHNYFQPTLEGLSIKSLYQIVERCEHVIESRIGQDDVISKDIVDWHTTLLERLSKEIAERDEPVE